MFYSTVLYHNRVMSVTWSALLYNTLSQFYSYQKIKFWRMIFFSITVKVIWGGYLGRYIRGNVPLWCPKFCFITLCQWSNKTWLPNVYATKYLSKISFKNNENIVQCMLPLQSVAASCIKPACKKTLILYSIIMPFDAFETSCIWKYYWKWSICSLEQMLHFP